MGTDMDVRMVCHLGSLPLDAGKGAVVMPDKILLGYYLCAALGIFFGIALGIAYCKIAKVQPEEPDEIDNFDFWIDD